jgi:molybdopterin converting factor small subunit
MKIKVKLYASLRQYVPGSNEIIQNGGVEVEEGTSVAEVMNLLTFPAGMKILALVNGGHCRDMATPLKEGDLLLFYPLMSGG